MIALSSETTVGDCQLFIVFSQFIMALQYESLQCSVRGRDCLEELPLPSLIITQIGSFHVCSYIREDRNNKNIFQGKLTPCKIVTVSANLRITLMLNH